MEGCKAYHEAWPKTDKGPQLLDAYTCQQEAAVEHAEREELALTALEVAVKAGMADAWDEGSRAMRWILDNPFEQAPKNPYKEGN